MFRQLLLLAGFCLCVQAFALPAPHAGMVNTAFVQDVGAAYTEAQAQGNSTFLIAVKAEPTCIPLRTVIASVEICIKATCTFYNTNTCVNGTEGFSFTVNGPGDAHTIPMPAVVYASYKCSVSDDDINKATHSIATTPHDSSGDGASMMVR